MSEDTEQLNLPLAFVLRVEAKGIKLVIHDGPNRFPESSVEYTKFKAFSLQQMFAYLREKEKMLQLDLKRYEKFPREWELRQAQLNEVQSHLIWMVQHATGDAFEAHARRNGLW